MSVVLCGVPGRSSGQQPGATAAAPFTVTGKVINGLTGAAIPRALVKLNARGVLTDSLGVFTFPQFEQTQGSISVTKPGFAQSRLPVGLGTDQQTVNTTSTLELKLYPDALITGMVIGSDGLPLAKVSVNVLRRFRDVSGERLQPIGFGQTDRRGVFRFEEPPGEYRVHLGYTPRVGDLGEVMLPLDYPEQGPLEGASTIKVESGQEARVELRPKMSKGYEVGVRMERSGAASSQGGQMPRFIVSTAQGLSFNVAAQNAPGGGMSLLLPNGSYHLRALLQDRGGMQEAETQVTVASRAVQDVVLRFSPQPQIPVQLVLDPVAAASQGAASAQQPTLAQLNLRLEQLGGHEENFSGMVMLVGDARLGSIVSVSPGTYRLRGGGSLWYVRAAAYGTTDLMVQPLVIGSGSPAEPIRLFCSNQTGQVTGTVRANGTAAAGWIYFIAQQASLMPVQVARSGGGTYSRALPPGTYTVIALDRQFAGDLTSPEVVAKLVDAQTVDVAGGGSTMLDLKLQSVETLE